MKVELTTVQFNVLFESLHRYQTRLKLDACALVHLGSNLAAELLKEHDAVEDLIQHLSSSEEADI